MSLDPITERINSLNSILTRKDIELSEADGELSRANLEIQKLETKLGACNGMYDLLARKHKDQKETINQLTDQIANLSHK